MLTAIRQRERVQKGFEIPRGVWVPAAGDRSCMASFFRYRSCCSRALTQSHGVATAVCLQLAAIVPNFLIQEHFDPFNEPWTKQLVTWTPELDVKTGHLPIPTSPGLGLDLNMDVVREHPYDPNAYFDTSKPGWERRLAAGAKRIS